MSGKVVVVAAQSRENRMKLAVIYVQVHLAPFAFLLRVFQGSGKAPPLRWPITSHVLLQDGGLKKGLVPISAAILFEAVDDVEGEVNIALPHGLIESRLRDVALGAL
jgi:hypothetical protein